MDVLPQEGYVTTADHEPVCISLTDLALDEKYHANGVRAILQLHEATEATTVTPAGGMCYLDVGDNQESKAKRASDSDSKTNIASIAQDFLDIKISLEVYLKTEEAQSRPLLCDLYFDSASSNLILRNRSIVGIDIRPIAKSKADAEYASEQLFPRQTRTLGPGTYAITIHGSCVLDLRVFARGDILDTTRMLVRPVLPGTHRETSLKRALPVSVSQEDSNDSLDTRSRQIRKTGRATGVDNNSILFRGTGAVDISSSQSLVATGNPLVDLSQHGVLDIPGVLGVEGYRIHKRKVISKRAQSEVYLAQHSGMDDVDIVVKVLKIRSASAADNGRSFVDHAEAWLREYNIHNGLKHESIVALYGGDARFLAFYQEFIPGYDLSTKGVWRNAADDCFRGSEDDAFRVWVSIARALEYLHDQGLEHNDVKPGNILFSDERGAVLCDFGLSRPSNTSNASRATSGGTPFYIPPEYITNSQRGKPGDVFALGVTVLYLKKLRPLPDAEGQGFIIAEIYSLTKEVRQAARNKMMSWLAKVQTTRGRLELSDPDAFILRDMLSPEVKVRPTAAEMVKRLQSELLGRSHRPQVKEKPRDRAAGERERGGSPNSVDHGSTTEENGSIEWVLRSPR